MQAIIKPHNGTPSTMLRDASQWLRRSTYQTLARMGKSEPSDEAGPETSVANVFQTVEVCFTTWLVTALSAIDQPRSDTQLEEHSKRGYGVRRWAGETLVSRPAFRVPLRVGGLQTEQICQ